MDATLRGQREIAVPISVFTSLRRSLASEAGALPAIHALHAAGYAAGSVAGQSFPSSVDEDPRALPQEEFWGRFSSYFARRGWGTLHHDATHDAVGILASTDWAEGAEPGDEHASCSLSTGFLSGMLSHLAGGPVAVLEVTCRARGDDRCTFAFGSATAIHELYGHLLEGTDLSGALASL